MKALHLKPQNKAEHLRKALACVLDTVVIYDKVENKFVLLKHIDMDHLVELLAFTAERVHFEHR